MGGFEGSSQKGTARTREAVHRRRSAMSEQAPRKLSFAQIATRAAKKEQEENDNKRKEERAAEEAEEGSNNSRKDDWRRKQRWDETEPKMGGERT